MKFSVVISTRNRAHLIQESIDSVLSQRYKDFELIVVDDGSTDATPQVLESYGEKIQFLRQSNRGGPSARNAGASVANGDYLAFLDDDDVFFPQALETYARVIDRKHQPALVVGQPLQFKGSSKAINAPTNAPVKMVTFPNFLQKRVSVFTTCSMLVVRKDEFRDAGGFRDENGLNVHRHDDFRFLLSMGRRGPVVIVVEPNLFGYRRHDSNSVKNFRNVVPAISLLVRDERLGLFTKNKGGKKWDRYALLGGTAGHWCVLAFKGRDFASGTKLIFASWPMILVSLITQIRRKLGRAIELETLAETNDASP